MGGWVYLLVIQASTIPIEVSRANLIAQSLNMVLRIWDLAQLDREEATAIRELNDFRETKSLMI
jgi:hypothetical protein